MYRINFLSKWDSLLFFAFFTFIACGDDEPTIEPEPEKNVWLTSDATLSQARASVGFAKLSTNELMIIGGKTGTTTLASTEIFNSETEVLTTGANLNNPRSMSLCITLNDGRILVTGGLDENGDVLNSCEIYDPTTETFSMTGSMNVARARHKINLLPDGKILVSGGSAVLSISNDPSDTLNGSHSSTEIYDPATETWSISADMSIKRVAHATSTLPNGDILISGGLTPAGMFPTVAVSTEIYKVATETIEPAADMLTGRSEHLLTSLSDGTILATGGGTLQMSPSFDVVALTATEIYDSNVDTWTAAADMSVGRAGHSAFIFDDGKVLLPGGDSGSLLSLTPTNTCEIFDNTTSQWTTTDTLPNGLVGYTGMVANDRKIVLIGGTDGTAEMNKIYIFNY
jgi:N-acetylneuraminic acid mutarotase